jgi:serine protease AprX
MKHFKKRATILFLLILASQIFLPGVIISLKDLNSKNFNDLNKSDSILNSNNLFTQEQPIIDNPNNDNPSIYNSNLDNYLNEKLQSSNKKEKITVIINFIEPLAKKERLTIIDSLFNDYEIIYNYDIISGTFLKINSLELIEKEALISQEASIISVYKSVEYYIPVIRDQKLGANNLNIDSFPNWWIKAVGAENLSYNGSGVSVAVLDTGIYSHPDLNIVNESAFTGGVNGDLFGHGTHAAGIIGSSGISSGGEYRGVAPGVSLIDARISNSSGTILDGHIIEAIEWASQPSGADADIISMSFGGDQFNTNPSIWNAISNASDTYGTIFVASAGNSGPTYYTASTPASHPDVISVGATDINNNLAYFSSWGPSLTYIGYPDVVAPGVNIISTSSPNSVLEKEMKFLGDFFDFSGSADYIPLSGTSMSCPMVAGAIAILKNAYPNISGETARIALYEGAYKLPKSEETYIPKSGTGLINVSASLEYLNRINSSHNDINNITKIFPDILPFKPFDLLNFPGDSQTYNLSVISGTNNTIGIELPSDLSGININIDNDNFTFHQAGINFTTLTIEIEDNCTIATHNFSINITINGKKFDTINVSIDIRLPEQKILLDSYHGLNDWLYPELSFPQIGFYEAMSDIADLNISINYSMEYWQIGYNKSSNNSILTEELLAQYDLIVLQNPILPYSPMEIENLKKYYNNGGNILYLGTQYQHVCSDNINALLSELGINASIKQENIVSEKWIGIGTILNSLNTVPENHSIFEGVNRSLWLYGNTFNVSGSAETIAEIDNKSVAVAYNGSSSNKGKFVAFGDLNWLYYDYTIEENNYKKNHELLLNNLIDYFFGEDEISINIKLNADRIESGNLKLSVYVKNTTSNSFINTSILNSNNLTARISNSSFDELINLSSLTDGIALNYSYIIPTTSYKTYKIEVILTLGSNNYTKTTKILYFNSSSVPIIKFLDTSKPKVNKGKNISLEAQMDSPEYNLTAYLSLYSDGFHNSEKTINQTYLLSSNSIYENEVDLPAEPSGYGIFYIIPYNGNYSNPNSPRKAFEIINKAPDIDIYNSIFRFGFSGYKRFSDTISESGATYVQQAYQGDIVNLQIDAYDEDGIDSQLQVSVNLFIAAISEPEGEPPSSTIILIPPASFEEHSLSYNSESGKYTGSFRIPYSMLFESIKGIKSLSTSTGFFPENYIGILYIDILDNNGKSMTTIIEGESIPNPFIIATTITFNYELLEQLSTTEEQTNLMPIIVALLIIGGIFGLLVLIYAVRREKIRPEYIDEYSRKTDEEFAIESSQDFKEGGAMKEGEKIFYCPFCGKALDSPKKYCPRCGENIEFLK